MSEADDIACLREYVRTGSGLAFARIVRKHGKRVFATALRTVRDAHAAEDVAQTVFAALGSKAQLLTEREVSISAWLVTTARFTAIDARRRLLRRRQHERRAAAMKRESVDGENGCGLNAVIRAGVEDALGRLRPTDRRMIALRYLEGRGIRELAEELGCTEDAARQRLGRAVEKLRAGLGKDLSRTGEGGARVAKKGGSTFIDDNRCSKNTSAQ